MQPFFRLGEEKLASIRFGPPFFEGALLFGGWLLKRNYHFGGCPKKKTHPFACHLSNTHASHAVDAGLPQKGNESLQNPPVSFEQGKRHYDWREIVLPRWKDTLQLLGHLNDAMVGLEM